MGGEKRTVAVNPSPGGRPIGKCHSDQSYWTSDGHRRHHFDTSRYPSNDYLGWRWDERADAERNSAGHRSDHHDHDRILETIRQPFCLSHVRTLIHRATDEWSTRKELRASTSRWTRGTESSAAIRRIGCCVFRLLSRRRSYRSVSSFCWRSAGTVVRWIVCRAAVGPLAWPNGKDWWWELSHGPRG